MRLRRHARWLFAWGLALTFGSVVLAEFQLVDDFETCEIAPLDGQNAWVAESSACVVAFDPIDSANKVLAVASESTWLYHPASILDGATRTLFLRMRVTGHSNYSFGASDRVEPTRFDEFVSELNVADALNELRINDGGIYKTLKTLVPDRWYNCWLLIDHFDDVTQVYLHDRDQQDGQATDLLESGGETAFDFRQGGAGTVQSFFVKTGGGSGPAGTLFVDDVYIESSDGLNLSNPTAGVPPPAAAGRVPNKMNWPDQPLLLDKAGSLIHAEWGASCLAGDSDYEIYEGVLGDFYSHQPMLCTTGGSTGVEIDPSGGSRYYIVVPRNAEREGSYGIDSEGLERPQGQEACLVQKVGVCP